ncbi:MAG: hypothetical protein IPM39_11200 [Chloroflexi bacterium]|nr:hypothetical protein [Chloroflexota bacterium]
MPNFLPKPYDMHSLLTVVRAELALAVSAPMDLFINPPLNGKNGDGNGRWDGKKLYSQSVVEHLAQQPTGTDKPALSGSHI